MEPKVAIICLTRGYSDINAYNMLIQRNISIYNHINIKRKWWPWPLLIFHEGNIEESHQEYIRARSGSQPLFFIDIVAEFAKPPDFDDNKEVDKFWPWGYKCMCRFFAGRFRHYVRDFDYTIRIDEDCFISQWSDTHPLGRPGALFQTPYLSDEVHDLTNEILPKITSIFLTCRGLAEREGFYNHKFPYTNVWIISSRLFDKPYVTEFFDYLEAYHFSLYYRIGDLPILGVIMNQFLEEGEHFLLEGVEYIHTSHNIIVGNGTISPYTNSNTS